MASARSLSESEVARVVAALREAVKLAGGGSAFERRTGLTQQTVSKYLSGGGAPGIAFAEQLAIALGFSRDHFRDPVNPTAAPPAIPAPDRYPARVKAIARAREDGRSDRAIQAVATFQGHDADALTVEAWSALIMNFEAAFAAGKLGKPKKP